MRAELLAAVEGPAAADAAFAGIADAKETSPDTYLAWATVMSGARSADVLEAGIDRFPDAARLWTALAANLMSRGRAADARDAATRSLELDAADLDAWLLAISSTARAEPTALPSLVEAFEDRFGSDRSALVTAATRVGATVHEPSDPLGQYAVAWLDRALGSTPDPLVRTARARVNAARRQWGAALADLDGVLSDEPRNADVLELRAEVLSYAGRHAEAVAAYDDYLALAPDDYAAARQQARVAAWGQDFEGSARRYAALLETHPSDRALQFEVRAKQAFYSGRWKDAIEAYDQWLAVEPDDSEAAFERAQALEQHGDAAGARTAWSALTARVPDHREANAARHRFELAGRPAVLPVFAYQSADGYGGQRLLDVTESGASALLPQGHARRWTLLASLGRGRGERRRLHLPRRPGRRRCGVPPGGRGGADGARRVVLTRSGGHHHRRLVGGVARGRVMAAEDDVPATALARERRQHRGGPGVDDLGGRRSGELARQQVRGGGVATLVDRRQRGLAGRRHGASPPSPRPQRARPRWRGAPGRASTPWRRPTSPRRRSSALDAGLEWRHWLAQPRFADDLARYVSATYLFGVDNHGTAYHHPAVRGAWELNDMLLIEARGDWIESAVYHQAQATLLLRIGGPVRR